MRDSRFLVAGVELVIREQLLEEEDEDDAVDAFFFASESLAGSTGQKVWESALLAVRFLEAHPEHVRGKQVVELGCGTGVCGLAAAAIGASDVLLTDMASVVAYCTAGNVEVNPALKTVRCAPLDWLQFEASKGESFDPALSFDTVLASDCVWLVELLPSFAYTMAHLLQRRDGSVGVVAQTERSRADSVVFASTALLLQELQRHGIVVEQATPNIFLLRM